MQKVNRKITVAQCVVCKKKIKRGYAVYEAKDSGIIKPQYHHPMCEIKKNNDK